MDLKGDVGKGGESVTFITAKQDAFFGHTGHGCMDAWIGWMDGWMGVNIYTYMNAAKNSIFSSDTTAGWTSDGVGLALGWVGVRIHSIVLYKRA